MLSCAGYNHAWVKAYAYDDDYAPLLPTGTIVHVIAWYDNTSKNPRVVDPQKLAGTRAPVDRRHVHLPEQVDRLHRRRVQGAKSPRARRSSDEDDDVDGQQPAVGPSAAPAAAPSQFLRRRALRRSLQPHGEIRGNRRENVRVPMVIRTHARGPNTSPGREWLLLPSR